MPTPFEPDFTVRAPAPTVDPEPPPAGRNSIFGNYSKVELEDHAPLQAFRQADAFSSPAEPGFGVGEILQQSIDLALVRSCIYRFLAQAFTYPDFENWRELCSSQRLEAFTRATQIVGVDAEFRTVRQVLDLTHFDAFEQDYIACFGHAARGSCPINEIEYGDIKADPLFQPHRLADLAGYYRAFGVELTTDSGERPDHLCVELEFMSVLAARRAFGLEHQHDADAIRVGVDAERGFLRHHLGRWTPAFARRVRQAAVHPPLIGIATFLESFIRLECSRAGIEPGSHDLLLRPVDEQAESLCASCALAGPQAT